jgi:hypothetical protein
LDTGSGFTDQASGLVTDIRAAITPSQSVAKYESVAVFLTGWPVRFLQRRRANLRCHLFKVQRILPNCERFVYHKRIQRMLGSVSEVKIRPEDLSLSMAINGDNTTWLTCNGILQVNSGPDLDCLRH